MCIHLSVGGWVEERSLKSNEKEKLIGINFESCWITFVFIWWIYTSYFMCNKVSVRFFFFVLITWNVLINFIDIELISAFYQTWTHLFNLLATLLRKAGPASFPSITMGLARYWATMVGKKIVSLGLGLFC